MSQIAKDVHISELVQHIPDDCALICCASFEDRCLCVPKAIAERISDLVIYRNSSIDIPRAVANRDAIKNCFPAARLCDVPFVSPEIVSDSMAKIIERLSTNRKNIVIDTTTFTHETLLILLRIIHLFNTSFDNVLCLYTGAGGYSPGLSPENTWLSKGCKDVRNVIGFPGVIKPKEKTNLIILAGFELERATKLIELVEPDYLILGNGIDPVNEKISDAMAYFRARFDAWRSEYKNVVKESFDFSCKSIETTVTTLTTTISKAPQENYILVPLNTKLSTISAAIVALENRTVQLCYAVPEIYNCENYSIPGEKVAIVNLNEFSVFQLQN